MNNAAIGHRERPTKALRCQLADHASEAFRNCVPCLRARAGGGESTDRIDARAHVYRSRRKLPALHERREVLDGNTRGGA